MRYLAATDGRRTNQALRSYLEPRLGAPDTVHVVHSLKGEEDDAGLLEDESDVVLESREALDTIENQLATRAEVETHQLVRGNEPHEDVIGTADEVDADEIVLGVRKRNPTAKVVFGSVAQKILLNSNRPMAVVPKMAV